MTPANRAYVFDFDAPPAVDAGELKRLLGGKGAGLVTMSKELSLPVPPGYVITTAASLSVSAGQWPTGLDDELRDHMDRLAQRVGRRFGDPDDPLLVSVRSGAPVSMPGMMDTILNLGLNDELADGLGRAVGDPSFAANCLNRFRASYRAVIGADDVPDEPWIQLRNAVQAVFRSWNSDRARSYREREGIPDDLGTAVTVQAMVFGNRGADSGTGVVFSRNPATGENELYGDVLFNAQGEDVVAGTHATQPISALDSRLPSVAAELRRDADVLERHLADLADIEFTIEEGRLWLLQVRVGKRSPRAALRIAAEMADDASFPLTRRQAVERVAGLLPDPPAVFVRSPGAPPPIATGLPASPGVATGVIVTSSEAVVDAAEAGQSAILVRSETSPEDVRGMSRAAGILTARGGLASHAAVVARGWGIPAVVGVANLVPGEDGVEIGGQVLDVGQVITIDGGTGEVFAGELAGRREVAPEAAALLAWASELGIDVTPEPPLAQHSDRAGTVDLPVVIDDVLRLLLIRGSASVAQLGDALLATVDEVKPIVDGLVSAGRAEVAGDLIRPTAQGKISGAAAFDAERAAAGMDAGQSSEMLDQFHGLDARVKDLVTAWQVRDIAGEQVLNDHADAAYDSALLEDLAELHVDVVQWLRPLATQVRQFRAYGERLGRALGLALAGDQRFVASPRVDSYHTVWFELHEHLIRLAGRKRADEIAAGRA